MDIVEDTYAMLEANGLIENHSDFSVKFLNKSRRYFSMVRASDRDASVDTLVKLAANLKRHIDVCKNSNYGEVRQRVEFLSPLTQKGWTEMFKQALVRRENLEIS